MTIFALEGSYVLTYCQCLHHRQGINCSLLHALFYYICNLSCVPVQSVPNVYILPSSVLGSLFSNSSFYLMVTSSSRVNCTASASYSSHNSKWFKIIALKREIWIFCMFLKSNCNTSHQLNSPLNLALPFIHLLC